MASAYRVKDIDEPFTESDHKALAKELSAPHVDLVAFVEHDIQDKRGNILSHKLTATFGPGPEYDPALDPKQTAREAARVTGEEIAKALAKQRAG